MLFFALLFCKILYTKEKKRERDKTEVARFPFFSQGRLASLLALSAFHLASMSFRSRRHSSVSRSAAEEEEDDDEDDDEEEEEAGGEKT